MKHITKTDQISIAVNHHNMYGVNAKLDDFDAITWDAFCTKLYVKYSVTDATNIMNSILTGNIILFDTEMDAQNFIVTIMECTSGITLSVIYPDPVVDFVWSHIIGERNEKTANR